MKRINIGLLGLGNIGSGTYKVLELNRKHIEATTGLDLRIAKILELDTTRERGFAVGPEKFTQDPEAIFADPDIDIVIELLGGVEPATSHMLAALKAGKSVVTANKAALAENYEALTEAAKASGAQLRFEASVGGGIPLVGAITELLCANEFTEILGILNGTTNYILTKMAEEGRAYEEVLKEAQALGFAEADPTADVEGHDVANKLSILMSIVFGTRVRPEGIPTRGISQITKKDIEEAEAEGCVIKLLASAFKTADGVECFVQPTYLNKTHPLADVRNEFNALFIKGNAVDDLMLYGKGAGPFPTASAVLGDAIAIAKTLP
ncbi:MAG: homoserine dehydrogenase [Clostridiales Family XIII bacterium]|jgi:homoserine dehydrogenase|nr:homoserine dehydrogenase [Clostridiales Family XIII bacterium]